MDAPSRHELPERLRRVVELGAEGLTDKELATELGISPHTVDAHWRRIREWYGASSRAEAIAKHLREAHAETVAALEREIEERKWIETELREANEQLSKALEERNAVAAQLIESYARQDWKDSDERERLLRLEAAVEASGTMVYEGECGGAWRKYWVTRNLAGLGHAPEDFVSGELRVANLMFGDDLMANYVQFQRAVEKGRPAFTTYYRLKTADGEVRWIRDRMTLLRDGSGQPTRYFGAGTDVTDLVGHLDPATLHRLMEEDA